jgi:hypothetical protein
VQNSSLGKQAYFLYDLDSLFNGNLKACVKSDGSVQFSPFWLQPALAMTLESIAANSTAN